MAGIVYFRSRKSVGLTRGANETSPKKSRVVAAGAGAKGQGKQQ